MPVKVKQAAVPANAFHGEVSGDLSAGVAIALYLRGSTTAYSVGANDTVVITDIIVIDTADAFNQIDVFDGTDMSIGAGELIAHTYSGSNGTQSTITINLKTPRVCQKGTTPRAKSNTGASTVIIYGYIEKE